MSRRGLAGALAAGTLLLTLGWLGLSAPAAPSFEQVRAGYRPSYSRLLDRDGGLLHELRADPARRRLSWTPLAEISPALVSAVIAAEDRRFASHGGVDYRALAAAAWQGLSGGGRRGASTISMQLSSLLDPALRGRGGPRSFAQKWRQLRLARALEGRWNKDQILEAYLNLATIRGELQGVAAATSVLLGKAPHGVSHAEAAVLAVLLRAPGAEADAVARRARQLPVAQAVPPETIERAARRALGAPVGGDARVTQAPHIARRLLGGERAGAAVRSTLDGELQRAASEILRHQLLALRSRHVRDGAVLVADNATGEVLAYVGSSADLSSARHVDGVLARRRAGSSLKPFLYGHALDRRLVTAASLLEDSPLEVAVAGGLYRPRNYDELFRGPVSVRAALAGSLNVPAVRTLGLVGPEAFVQQLRRLGFGGLDEEGDFYGPALALGSADVSLWDLTNAYRALAGGGVWSPLRLAPDAAPPTAPRRVYSAETTFVIAHILADRESRSLTFGLDNPLATRFWTAVKTGTSRDMRDNWCVGFSERYTVGVWVGNFPGEPMRDVSGVSGAAPVWREVMEWLHHRVPSRAPSPPPGLVARAPAGTHGAVSGSAEWFLAGTEPAAAGTGAAATADRARIVAPVARTIVALDPDVPAARQRMVFEAAGATDSLRWRLGADDLGPARELVIWAPIAGHHALVLVDEREQIIDSVTFEVRGVR